MSSDIAVRSDCRLCLHSKLTKVFDLPLTPPGEQLKLTIDEKNPDLVPIDLYQCVLLPFHVKDPLLFYAYIGVYDFC